MVVINSQYFPPILEFIEFALQISLSDLHHRCDVSIVAPQRKPNLKPPELVASSESLDALTKRLAARGRIAFDTEAASFHRYIDRVYLVQVCSDSDIALVDPLAVQDLSPLGDLLADSNIEVVFHDADYDLRTLNRDYGFVATNVFDTRIAAQLAGEDSVGLGALLDKYFKVTANKKMQRADWSRRPLTEEMVSYAADDTRYLLPLRDRLSKLLKSVGRMEWAEEEFSLLEGIRWTQSAKDEQAFLRIKGAKALPRRALAVLRELHSWREKTASSLDRAPFRVVGNSALIALAKETPSNLETMQDTDGIPASVVKRYGNELVKAIKKGLKVAPNDRPSVTRSKRPLADHAYDRRLAKLKTLRNETALEHKMDSGLLCPNGTLQAIARAAPINSVQLLKVSELRRWQRGVLGDANILSAIRNDD